MLLMLVASAAGARAVPFDFMYTGSVATFTVPTTGSYQILVFGAQGGAGTFSSIVGAGGLGAEISGDFGLTAGDVLQIAVGGKACPVAPDPAREAVEALWLAPITRRWLSLAAAVVAPVS